MGLNESIFFISFRESLQKLSSRSDTKTINFQWEKRALDRFLHGQMKICFINTIQKSRIWEIKNLLTDADISTDSKKILLVRQNLRRF